jgi:flagellar motor switch protein FliG
LAGTNEPHGYAESARARASAHQPRRHQPETPFAFLHDSEAAELARLLEHEHPQTIALVLAHVGSARASEVLLCFSKAQQGEVVRRLMDLDEANPAALEAVKRNLETRLRAHIEGRKRRASGLATVQQILKAAGPAAERELRRNLSQHADLAQVLGQDREETAARSERTVVLAERRMFEELSALPDADLALVLRRVDRQCLVLALAGSAVRFAERVLRLLPAKEAKALRRALQNLGSLPLSDIEQAQDELVWTAMEMDAAEQIHWPQALVGGLA